MYFCASGFSLKYCPCMCSLPQWVSASTAGRRAERSCSAPITSLETRGITRVGLEGHLPWALHWMGAHDYPMLFPSYRGSACCFVFPTRSLHRRWNRHPGCPLPRLAHPPPPRSALPEPTQCQLRLAGTRPALHLHSKASATASAILGALAPTGATQHPHVSAT